jgi:hypothetical protein
LHSLFETTDTAKKKAALHKFLAVKREEKFLWYCASNYLCTPNQKNGYKSSLSLQR